MKLPHVSHYYWTFTPQKRTKYMYKMSFVFFVQTIFHSLPSYWCGRWNLQMICMANYPSYEVVCYLDDSRVLWGEHILYDRPNLWPDLNPTSALINNFDIQEKNMFVCWTTRWQQRNMLLMLVSVRLSHQTWKVRVTVSSTQATQQIPNPQRRSSRRPAASTMKTWVQLWMRTIMISLRCN